MINSRDFDYSHPLERALAEHIRYEGVVLWTHDAKGKTRDIRYIIAVVAGDNGPELVCGRAWPAPHDEGVITRVDLRIPVETACQKHLNSNLEFPLSQVDHFDGSILDTLDGQATYLWGTASVREGAYLLRVTPHGATSDQKQLVIATAVNDRSLHDLPPDVIFHEAWKFEAFKEWVSGEFGSGMRPKP